MFMRFVGGAIGHKPNDYAQQRPFILESIPDEAPNLYNDLEGIILHNTQDHAEAEEDDNNVDGDPEEVDSDEEVDFGYIDDLKSEGEDSEGEGSGGGSSEGKEPNDEDDDDVL
jgi:hypothetical protein